MMRVEEDVDDRWALHASDRALLGNKTGATRLGFAFCSRRSSSTVDPIPA